MWPYRADVPDPACMAGLGGRKSPAPRTRSRGRPPGGSHTSAGPGPRTPRGSREPAAAAWTPPMVFWPWEGDLFLDGAQKEKKLTHKIAHIWSNFYSVRFQRQRKMNPPPPSIINTSRQMLGSLRMRRSLIRPFLTTLRHYKTTFFLTAFNTDISCNVPAQFHQI